MLKKEKVFKLHIGPINNIVSYLIDNQRFLFTCSSDKSIKVYSVQNDQIICVKDFFEEVKDIKIVKDFSEELNFIISLKNGVLKVLNTSFEEIFEIPSRFKTNCTRYVLSANNPNKKESKGNFLLITEGNKIDIFTWIKEGSYKFSLPSSNTMNFPYPYPNSSFQTVNMISGMYSNGGTMLPMNGYM